MKHGVEHGYVLARRGDLDWLGILILVPKMCMDRLEIDMMASSKEVHVRYEGDEISKDVVHTESISRLKSRMHSEPGLVISVGDGIGGAYAAFKDMGFNIKEYVAVERDQLKRSVAASHIAEYSTALGSDIMGITELMMEKLRKKNVVAIL